MYALTLRLYLASIPNPMLTSTGFLSEQLCNGATAKMAKELKSAYDEHLPGFTLVCVPK